MDRFTGKETESHQFRPIPHVVADEAVDSNDRAIGVRPAVGRQPTVESEVNLQDRPDRTQLADRHHPIPEPPVNQPPKVSRIPLPMSSLSDATSKDSGIKGRLAAHRSAAQDEIARAEEQVKVERLPQAVGGGQSAAAIEWKDAADDPEAGAHQRSVTASRMSSQSGSTSVSGDQPPGSPLPALPVLDVAESAAATAHSGEVTESSADETSIAKLPLPRDEEGGSRAELRLPGSKMNQPSALAENATGTGEDNTAFGSAPTQRVASRDLPTALPARSSDGQSTFGDAAVTEQVDDPQMMVRLPSPNRGTAPSRVTAPPTAAATHVRQGDLPVARIVPNELRSNSRIMLTAPRFSARLVGPGEVSVGQATNYQLIVINEDNVRLPPVELKMRIPSGVDAVVGHPTHGNVDLQRQQAYPAVVAWHLNELSAGETASLPLQLTARDARRFDISVEGIVHPMRDATQVAVLQPTLDLKLQGPEKVELGVPAIYQLIIENSGEVAARDIALQLHAASQGSSQTTVERIEAGQRKELTLELTFARPGPVSIEATASAIGTKGASASLNVMVTHVELEAEIKAPTIVFAGAPLEYSINVRNQGDANARNVRLLAQLPPGADLSQIERMDNVQLRGRTVEWQIGTIRAREDVSLNLPVRLIGEGNQTLVIEVEDAAGNRLQRRVTTTVEAVADLSLIVSDPTAPAPVGKEVTYELRLTNRGSKDATNVLVLAQFSEGIEPTRAEGQNARVVPGQVLFSPVARIPAGETITLRVHAMAEVAGMHRFRVEVRAEDDIRLVHEESTRYMKAAAAGIK